MSWDSIFEKSAPGTHFLVLATAKVSLRLRAARFEVRDTIILIAPGSTRTAVLYRKPIEDSVVHTVVRHDVGAINIDGTRIAGGAGYEEEVRRNIEAFAKLQMRNPGWKNSSTYAPNVEGALKGRWPPNAALFHDPSCTRVGSERVKAPVINRFDDGMKPFGDGAGHTYTTIPTGDADGMEAVDVWECVRGCPSKVMVDQAGAPRFFPCFLGAASMTSVKPFMCWIDALVPGTASAAETVE